MLKRLMVVVALVVVAGFTIQSDVAQAEGQKYGVLNIQKVLLDSDAGKKAKAVFEKRMKELEEKFKTEGEKLTALQEEIEKKSSAWSEDKKAEKERELQLKQRELKVRSDDAKMELKQLQDKELKPILKALQEVVDSYGEKEGFALILDSKVAVLYAGSDTDISDAVRQELDKAMK